MNFFAALSNVLIQRPSAISQEEQITHLTENFMPVAAQVVIHNKTLSIINETNVVTVAFDLANSFQVVCERRIRIATRKDKTK